jgi:hypothetical protein
MGESLAAMLAPAARTPYRHLLSSSKSMAKSIQYRCPPLTQPVSQNRTRLSAAPWHSAILSVATASYPMKTVSSPVTASIQP